MPNDIVLSPPADLASPTLEPGRRRGPAILQRRDEDFITAVLEALRDEAGRDSLSASVAKARTSEGVLKLFQPVQREYHLAIFEANCDQPGRPPLDPARVAAAGLVVRRWRRDQELEEEYYEGWMRVGGRLRGWLRADSLGADEADPVSRLRRARQTTGVADLDRALAALSANFESGLLEEDVVPMFPAPPRICQSAGRTFFFGLIPTTSRETSESPASLASALGANGQAFGAADAAFITHLSEGLQGKAMELPLAGEMMQQGWYDAVELPSAGQPDDLSEDHWEALQDAGVAAHMRKFIDFLRQLTIEFDAFGNKHESKAIRDVLAKIQMPLRRFPADDPLTHQPVLLPSFVPADDFLKQAAAVLLGNQPDAPTPEMPLRWPTLEAGVTKCLQNALAAAFQARFSEAAGPPGRYDEPGAKYAIRAFVREEPDGVCPGRIHWSGYSEPFVIAPWYEGDGAPPTQVTLPNLGKLSSLMPNVSFVVPAALQGLMSGNPKDMLEGNFDQAGLRADENNRDGSGIAWICSFNIPVITFCAFLVLNIFLKLFSLIIRLALSISIKLPSAAIKLCIPFPKKDS